MFIVPRLFGAFSRFAFHDQESNKQLSALQSNSLANMSGGCFMVAMGAGAHFSPFANIPVRT